MKKGEIIDEKRKTNKERRTFKLRKRRNTVHANTKTINITQGKQQETNTETKEENSIWKHQEIIRKRRKKFMGTLQQN